MVQMPSFTCLKLKRGLSSWLVGLASGDEGMTSSTAVSLEEEDVEAENCEDSNSVEEEVDAVIISGSESLPELQSVIWRPKEKMLSFL